MVCEFYLKTAEREKERKKETRANFEDSVTHTQKIKQTSK